MFSKIRSLLFKLDPELAHTLAIKALKLNYNPINNIKKDNWPLNFDLILVLPSLNFLLSNFFLK